MAQDGRLAEGMTILLGRVDLSSETVRDVIAMNVHRRLARYLGREDFTTTINFSTRRVYADGGQIGRGVLERI